MVHTTSEGLSQMSESQSLLYLNGSRGVVMEHLRLESSICHLIIEIPHQPSTRGSFIEAAPVNAIYHKTLVWPEVLLVPAQDCSAISSFWVGDLEGSLHIRSAILQNETAGTSVATHTDFSRCCSLPGNSLACPLGQIYGSW